MIIEFVKTQGIEDWSVFVGSSGVSIPRSDACVLHMTGMQKVRTGWRQLVFASVSRVRPSRKIPAKQSVLLFCPICSTTFSPTLYISSLHTNIEEYFWEKTLLRDTRKTVCFVILSYLLHYILIHTIYTIITQMLRSASERKPYPQTLRVRDCYNHNSLCKLLVDFLQLLPLHFHTTERLITQTLTIPFQSVQ